MTETLLEALLDTLKTIPILYFVYLLILFLQRKMDIGLLLGKQEQRFGPVIGALLGSFPQCGFSAACTELYRAGIIGAGTLVSVYISTSDEAIPVLLSHPGRMGEVALLLASKVITAVLAGYLLANTVFRRQMKELAERRREEAELREEIRAAEEYERFLASQQPEGEVPPSQSEVPEAESSLPPEQVPSLQGNCGCRSCSSNVFVSALYHTLRTGIFVGITLAAINLALYWIGEERLAAFLLSGELLQPFVTALIGFVPGCAVSVLLVELYTAGTISFGAAVAGLSTGAGFGYLMLFRGGRWNGSGRNGRDGLKILACTYGAAVVSGLAVTLISRWMRIL